jgi:hypothetical protein
MLPYYISESNNWTIRTAPTASSALTMSLEDMFLLTHQTASLSGITYNGYESLLSFTASISGAIVGGEYRAELLNGNDVIWNGSIQVYEPQSSSKAEYETQNTQYISYETENKYVILQ